MIRSISASVYVFIWAGVLYSLSLADWYDHITRKQQTFRVYPWGWLLFTFTSATLLLVVAIGCSMALSRLIRIRFVVELLSVFSGIMAFLLLGDFIRRYTVPEITLHFPFSLPAIATGLFAFSIIWVIIHLLFHVKFKNTLHAGA